MKIIKTIEGEPVTFYKCLRCGFNTPTKCILISHLKRKIECFPILKPVGTCILLEYYKPKLTLFNCNSCNKCYKSAETLKKHICKSLKDPEPEQEINTETVEEIETIESQIPLAVSHKDDIPEPLKSDIIITDILNPRIDYINAEYIIELGEAKGKAYPILVEYIYFNDEHPENHVVYMKNYYHSEAYVFMNDRWQATSCSHALNQMMQVVRTLIFNIFTPQRIEYHDLEALHKPKLEKLNSKLLEHTDKYSRADQVNAIHINKEINGINEILNTKMAKLVRLQTLVRSISHKKESKYARFRKEIKSKLMDFDTQHRALHRDAKLHPIIRERCISVREWLEREVQIRLAAILDEL